MAGRSSAGAMVGLLSAVLACGGGATTEPNTSSDADELPAECRENFGTAIGRSLAAGGSALSGQPNQVQEQRDDRCRRALAVQRLNPEHAAYARQVELEQMRAAQQREAAQRLAEANARLEAARARHRAALEAQRRSTVPLTAPGEPSGRILIFGGLDRKTYLGCICDSTDSESVFNRVGTHGSRFRTDSIWNRFSDHASRFASTSACNPYATSPPVLVAEDGRVFGELTLSKLSTNANPSERLRKWLATEVCAHVSGDSPLLCNDGTESPTCTCGGPRRGCCSHHGGVKGCGAVEVE